METNINVRSVLNRLIQTCKDGQEGFLTAAENIDGGELRKLFSEYSLQRAKFAGELQAVSHELGDSHPENASSISGTVHRGWINLKTAIAGRDSHSILIECQRGECCAVSEFEEALKHQLPANIREIVSRQFAAVTATHDRMRALSDAGAPSWM